ncbi:Dipeptidyl aminopeptidase/acylaminoacyl peptidase [Lentzea fradiae]|uniref:Dipeptidyl aminopeptidase/acylaminoacyl peptidase n=1 Tax=Lentzea fradiae TaxID=200378 RepID=A0A1G7Y5E2_9PSEU|nr:S9 family peptidase [Lentzea fradiae]SDG91587.1 Dipeptidyl aminopeptidase/acylaminoacyl peptidase [Lentzea fradiae]
MRPEDLQLLTTPGTVAVSGDLVLVSITTPDLDKNTYRGGLHRVFPDGTTQPWTHGDRDNAQRISPDGRHVAFLRVHGKSKPQLYVAPVDGGEPRQLTDLPLGAGAPVWSPDSSRIAFVARVPEHGRYGTTDEAPEAEAPRRITRLDYRVDDVGFLGDRRPRLHVVDLDGEVTEVTDGSFDVSDPAWLDDATLVFVAPRDLGAVETLHSDLYTVPVAGGSPSLLVTGAGEVSMPFVAQSSLYWLGTEFTGNNAVARNHGLWRAALDGSGATRLTDEETVDVERLSGAPVADASGVLLVVRNRGALELRRIPFDGGPGEVLAGTEAAVRSFATDGSTVVAVVSTPDSPGQVELVGTGVRTAFPSLESTRRVVELTGSASDGYPVHGWLVLPDGDGPHPVVLAVHGGPFMYHSWAFFDEAQVYATAGYAVVLPNPRGSAGYGQAHGQAVVGKFGTVDVDDVLSLLDVALARPDCDAERVGVMGGSYGGFMTSWLSAHHGERFKAAWSERAVNAWDSFTGSSDIGYFFADAYCGTDPEAQRAMSPLTYAEKITLPFAVVHSEHDWRCPVEQAQRMFVALKRRGVETELLLFPGEGHELTRSGQPRHRKQRFDAVLQWWDRYLKA